MTTFLFIIASMAIVAAGVLYLNKDTWFADPPQPEPKEPQSEWRRLYLFHSYQDYEKHLERFIENTPSRLNDYYLCQYFGSYLRAFISSLGMSYQDGPNTNPALLEEELRFWRQPHFWDRYRNAMQNLVDDIIPKKAQSGWITLPIETTDPIIQNLIGKHAHILKEFVPYRVNVYGALRELIERTYPVFNWTAIPTDTRFQHHWIVAPPGAGKSTLLSHFIQQDLERVRAGQASVVVMESTGQLVKAIERLKIFAPGGELEGRLVSMDPEDVEYPVALNIFDLGTGEITNLRDREAFHNSTISMLDYVFRALLGAELTSRQSTMFNFTVQLLLNIPGATIDTMIELMNEGAGKYRQYLAKCDDDTKSYFDLKFNAPQLRDTKTQVVDRLFAVKRIRSLARMFSAPHTKLNFYDELGAGKVILINTSKTLLQEDGTELFSRFMIAMILLAVERRALISQADRMPVYFHIDEAQDAIRNDEKLPILLDTARKYKLGMIMAHQRLDQMKPAVLNALYGSTSIKMATNLSDANASALARNMNTTVDAIMNQPKHTFLTHVRGMEPFSFKVDEVDFSKQPKMTEHEYVSMKHSMRAAYSIMDRPQQGPKKTPTPDEDPL